MYRGGTQVELATDALEESNRERVLMLDRRNRRLVRGERENEAAELIILQHAIAEHTNTAQKAVFLERYERLVQAHSDPQEGLNT